MASISRSFRENGYAVRLASRLPSPQELIQAIGALNSLLNRVHKESGGKSKVEWGVQVESGSDIIWCVPQTEIKPNDQFRVILKEKLEEPEESRRDPDVKKLASIKKSEDDPIVLSILTDDLEFPVISSIEVRLDTALPKTEFKEYGSIQGYLGKLDSHEEFADKSTPTYVFAIYEPIWLSRIECKTGKRSLFDKARDLYEQEVIVQGLVTYNLKGIPKAIGVDEIAPLIRNENFDYKATRGILKNTGERLSLYE